MSEEDSIIANVSSRPPAMVLMERKFRKPEKRRNQYIGGIVASLNGFCAGTVLAWTSPAMQHILQPPSGSNTSTPNPPLPPPSFTISTFEEAAVGATLMFGAALAAIPSGKCADLFGRKITLLLIGLLYMSNYILIACATNLSVLLIARLFAGVALGGSCVVAPMYIAEITEESLKGILGSSFSLMLTLGILYTNVIGVVTEWLGLAIALALTSGIAALSILFLPETPFYLIAGERFGKARKSLMFYRGDEDQVSEELTELQKHLREHQVGSSIWDLFTKRCYRRPLIATLGVFAYQQFCGINAVIFNLMPIFSAANVSPWVAAIVPNLLTICVGAILVLIIEKKGRKFFMLLSSATMTLGLAGLAIYFQFSSTTINVLVPTACVGIFMAGFAVGIGPIPWVLLIELFTAEIKGIASGVVAMTGWISAMVVTFSYPYLKATFGSAITFWALGVLNILGWIFVRFAVPETKVQLRGK
ncbi:solute carrier family 2, facilitated glucose transporter member 8-like [Euwallacea fornicatus]|uniref:solute carrier family 2, facilitated glucose transporter member 8-like n=1 Tax=Euwallacea fornicatus TaxID=995702 RepID=UPI0033902BCD